MPKSEIAYSLYGPSEIHRAFNYDIANVDSSEKRPNVIPIKLKRWKRNTRFCLRHILFHLTVLHSWISIKSLHLDISFALKIARNFLSELCAAMFPHFPFQEIIPMQDLVRYTKSSNLSTSHIHLYDAESVPIACSIFKVSFSLCLSLSLSLSVCLSLFIWLFCLPFDGTQNIGTGP